jgi:hypothetical protein
MKPAPAPKLSMCDTPPTIRSGGKWGHLNLKYVTYVRVKKVDTHRARAVGAPLEGLSAPTCPHSN